MSVLKVYLCLFLLALTYLPLRSHALSCTAFQDRIIAKCSNGHCTDLLYIKEVASHPGCERRPTIEAVPSWAKPAVELETRTRGLSNEQNIFELVLERKYWPGDYSFSGADEYIQLAKNDIEALHFYRSVNLITDTSIAAQELEWTNKAKKQHLKMTLWKLGDWLSGITTIVFLVFSIIWFNQWLSGNKGLKWLLLSFLTQSLIIMLSIFITMSWKNLIIGMVGMLTPTIWIYEIIHFTLTRAICRWRFNKQG